MICFKIFQKGYHNKYFKKKINKKNSSMDKNKISRMCLEKI